MCLWSAFFKKGAMSNVNVRCDHKKKLILKLKSAATLGFGFVMSFDKLCILVMTEGLDEGNDDGDHVGDNRDNVDRDDDDNSDEGGEW